MGSCAAPSAKGDDKFITTDYLQQCPFIRGLYHRQSPEISTDGTEMTLTNILVNAGVKVRLTDAYKIHHDKVIIIDRSTVETGSFNFTKAAEYSNSENALVLNDMPQVASVYLEHWQSRWETGRDWKSTY
ncbi:hypothetical protein EGJ82_28095 [Klebsiella pneumoniae]|nr:phospholipase D-like domain-containing protein [Klebsiella pneumoniae]RRY24567.1 hypothetical protein EGJ60_27880 [Klebsiella pneumoniae]RRY42478.1 hypothetical protein EGJ99_28165 [Klebsiella pneumoniae]RRY61443.1 hypothetical protein EGJ88_28025 [Klebsiella pneumoniae]RRY65211.1 hypothetical protein EGJ82_28095 [Klebsiella pneumoniae]RRY99936.1 hypothetical protein EGK00_28455 [Klebsiella pneumoniae]